MAKVNIDLSYEKSKPNYEFSEYFENTFKHLIETYDTSFDSLSDAMKGKIDGIDYGICACTYNVYYISPDNVSTFISDLFKAVDNHLLLTIDDYNKFAVASVKRFLCENGCKEISPNVLGMSTNSSVNPNEYTLYDILNICESDVAQKNIYSKYEIIHRLEYVKDDYNKMHDLYLSATLKSIVNGFPTIAKQMNRSWICGDTMFKHTIETFLLFTLALNTLTILNMNNYCIPVNSYRTSNVENNTITECCLLKTNDIMLGAKLPFNCNMRDVVLKDTTPAFDDVAAALIFMNEDPRSQISVLLRRYSKKTKCSIESDVFRIANMIFKPNKCWNDNPRGEGITTRDGDCRIKSINDVSGVQNDVGWLDRIAFSNNYTDGNYRRDAVGNNKVNPITNTLDALYQMYSGCSLSTNEDLTENILRVSSIMYEIIQRYKDEIIENYDLVRDVLCVLGEILTRDIIKLYHNNTQVMTFSDRMCDTVAPAYMYTEAFVFEEAAPSVQFKKEDGQTNALTKGANIKTKLGSIIRAIGQWITKSISKFSKSFNENHKREMEYFNKNKELNTKIAQAISSNQFNPILNNYNEYNVPGDELKNLSLVQAVAAAEKETQPGNTINGASIIQHLFDKHADVVNAIKTNPNDKAISGIVRNFTLYGKAVGPSALSGQKMTEKQWNSLISNIAGTAPLVEAVTKKFEGDLTTLNNEANQKLSKLTDNTPPEEQKKAQSDIEGWKSSMKTISSAVVATITNTLNKDVFGTSYKLYADIVAGYNQQFGSATQQTQNQNNQTQQQQPEANAAETQTDANGLATPDASNAGANANANAGANAQQ